MVWVSLHHNDIKPTVRHAGCDIRGRCGSDSTLNSPLKSGQINFPHFPKQGSDVS